MSSDEEDIAKKRTGKRLTRKMIGDSLSVLARSGDGLGHAYVRLQCPDRMCRDVEHLREFPHLRFVELPGNRVSDLSVLGDLPQLLYVDLSRNAMDGALGDFGTPLEHLQEVNVCENSLSSLGDGLSQHPRLERVRAARNKIADLSSIAGGCERLTVLDVSANRLASTASVSDLPALEALYCQGNKVAQVEGLAGLPELRVLNLRANRIARIAGADDPEVSGAAGRGGDEDGAGSDEDDADGGVGRRRWDLTPGAYDPGEEPWRVFADGELPALTHVNLRDNRISDAEDLRGLSTLPALTRVSVSGCPLADDNPDGYRIELLVVLPFLDKIDKEKVTENEREEATELAERRKAEREAEDEARRAEEEARRIAEEEGEGSQSEDEEGDEGDEEDDE